MNIIGNVYVIIFRDYHYSESLNQKSPQHFTDKTSLALR